MMEKEFIPYEEALELKELGFDEPCFAYYGISRIYQTEGEIMLEERQVSMTGNLAEKICLAPIYQQSFRWFRDNYNIYCEINVDTTTEPKFYFIIKQYEQAQFFDGFREHTMSEVLFRTYEEAEIYAFRKIIEIVKVSEQ